MANYERKDKKDKQNIQVYARIRPFNSKEIHTNSRRYLEVNGKDINVSLSHGSKRYTFDRVFDMHSRQCDIYNDAINPIINEVLKGYNCTVFAYGQTGSGKTHTMIGTENFDSAAYTQDSEVGIIPRAFSHIFDTLNSQKEVNDYTIRISYLEIYNEVLIDLLSPDEKSLRIYEDPKNKSSVQIQGLEEVTVYTKADVYELLRTGSEKKKMAATYMNQQSSRSHSVFTITVHTKETTAAGEELVKTGKLNLVDLAGSENIQRSGAIDQRAREAGNINQSLLTLGRVIKALVERAGHIPYRESKLTRILQDSLGGKTKTTIIATASPAFSNVEETISTLDYAFRARNIITKPEVNQRMCKTALIKGYLEEIDRLKKDLIAARKSEGFYLHADNYNQLIEESAKNREDYMRAVAECSEFENRVAELGRQRVELEEVYSVAQNELEGAKESLKKSTKNLKKLRTDRRIRQELIDTYDETQTKHFKLSKEMSAVLDAHIQEHHVLHDKMDSFYSAMKDNENATGYLDSEHARICMNIAESQYKLGMHVTRQFEDVKNSNNEFVKRHQVVTAEIRNLWEHAEYSYQSLYEFFLQNFRNDQELRLKQIKQGAALSEEQTEIVRRILAKQNTTMEDSLKSVVVTMEESKKLHTDHFKEWKTTIDTFKVDVEEKYSTIVEQVNSSFAHSKKLLLNLAEDLKELKQPVEEEIHDIEQMKQQMQQLIDTFALTRSHKAKTHTNRLDQLYTNCKELNKSVEEQWKNDETTRTEGLEKLREDVNFIDTLVQDGIDMATNAFTQIAPKLTELQAQNNTSHTAITEVVNENFTKTNETFTTHRNEIENLEESINQHKLLVEDFETVKKKASGSVTDAENTVASYQKSVKNTISNTIETVKNDIKACNNKLTQISGVVKGFLNQLKIVKPSGDTPARKNRLSYIIPRKVSTRVLQENNLDISLLDESIDEHRLSSDLFESSDSEYEFRGRFVSTHSVKPSSANNSLNGIEAPLAIQLHEEHAIEHQSEKENNENISTQEFNEDYINLVD